jgi:hypothetical protein
LRKSLLVVAGVVLLPILLAQTAPLAFLVFDTRVARPGRLPDGWRIHVNHGSPDVSVTEDAQGMVLHLKSKASSFGLEREVNVDPAQLPFLTWRWKVADLPRGGDFRHSRTDDQAAQVLVAFDDHRILSYIWDSTAPRGTMESASSIPLVRIMALVCRSGPAEAHQWLSEARNVREDYQRAYNRPARRVHGVRLQINSQHTGSSAESFFGEVAFRSTLQ